MTGVQTCALPIYNEELFLAGQRIDQFHDPSREADPYWEEALRRDPGDIQANTGMGLLDLRCARFAFAEQHFRKALERLTAKYTTPKNAEPFYFLGVALKSQGRTDEAFDAFYKAAWSQEWKSPAYFSLTEIASARGDFISALDYINRSLDANALNVRAYGLKSAVLRHLNRASEAQAMLTIAAQKTDPLDARLMVEQWLATRDEKAARPLFATLNAHPQNAQEIAAEFSNAGLWRDGSDVLTQLVSVAPDEETISPLIYYYLGDFAEQAGDPAKAAQYRRQAMQQSPEYVFPFQFEVIAVLRRAMTANPQDARAAYYLGNLLFDWQPAEAIALWEQSVTLDPTFPIAWRNLAQAYSHKEDDESRVKAISYLEKAVSLSDAYPTHFAELDRLYQVAGAPVEKRLALLEQHQATVVKKDESLAALIGLKTFVGKADEAIELLGSRTFSIWEGGTQFNTGEAWTDAHLVRGLQRFHAKQYREALDDFTAALNLSKNLRAEGGGASRQAEIGYWIGRAHDALGETNKARRSWKEVIAFKALAERGGGRRREISLARRAQRYYQALAQQRLGASEDVKGAFRELVNAGDAALQPTDNPDDTAPSSGERQPARGSTATAHYVPGLGYAGLDEKEKARKEFAAALASAPDHLGAKLALEQLNLP